VEHAVWFVNYLIAITNNKLFLNPSHIRQDELEKKSKTLRKQNILPPIF